MADRKILEISDVREVVLLQRSNRFLGVVRIDGKEEKVHIHDPGRLKELLYEGNRVLVKRADKDGRKTGWDLIAAMYGDKWILVNSAYHRPISEHIVRDILFPGANEVKPEVTVGHSRLDFAVKAGGETTGIEVKGCTLTENGIALFPDAPTERGRKHLQTLMDMIDRGQKAMLLVLVFRSDSTCFSPNERTDPEFAATFREAVKKGVEVRPFVLNFDGEVVRQVGEIGICKEGM